MKYLVYPKGYDPVVASEECSDFYRSLGCSWTEEDTKSMLELERMAVVSDIKPTGLWYKVIE